MTNLAYRSWVPEACESYVQQLARTTSQASNNSIASRIGALADLNRSIHERDCFNLNPATNVMNPRAEAMLSAGLGSRPSLGYPGDKYEMGLEAIEEIEVIAAELCAEAFQAQYAEIRVPSGAIANLYGFMAICKPGDTIIVPPATIGGHVTHHSAGAAGLFGLNIIEAPISADGYTIHVDQLASLVKKTRPTLITVGGSLNLFPHPVTAIREIADKHDAKVMFDAAHQCGIIAGGAWPNPLAEGADFMTMSTYKSLAGPAGGLIVTNDSDIAQRLDAIAFPGMTANFDAAKSAALALTMLDWREHGPGYAKAMVNVAHRFAEALDRERIPVFANDRGYTNSHQFAVKAAAYGGGQTASKKLRKAGFLACGIGLPIDPVAGDMNGLRFGTPELVRWGVEEEHTPQLASLVARALQSDDPDSLAKEVAAFRGEFQELQFISV